ncbi:hypothetical protein L7F22_006622 [Adiantum nelumboides]|nr:hypothetical protein [Adiantum nelumboides]
MKLNVVIYLLTAYYSENLTVVRSIALLGDMALHSYQSILQIVSDIQVLHCLLSHLNSTNFKIQKEACHTMTSIASGTQGQRALCGLGAVQKLMNLLFVLTGIFTTTVDQGDVTISLESREELYLSSPIRAKLLSGVLEALDALTCDNYVGSFGRILQGADVSILKGLQIIWKRFRNNLEPLSRRDHIRVLGKMIVWLAMELENFDEGLNAGCEDIVEILFGGLEAGLQHFWDEHWERSPLLIDENPIGSNVRCSILKAWHSESDSLFLEKLLAATLTCPPFICDDLETSQIYTEIESDIGKPLVFGQDIRLVKSVCTTGCTEPCSIHTVIEEDYHKICLEKFKSSERTYCIDAIVNTCASAYEQGYTIALRGLEFRCLQIAAIAEALAVCFGQATVGANLYLTPSNAQGFKPHYDDHCVLVWQLAGWKAWKLWAPATFLPRLYSQETKLEICTDEEAACKLALKEGNILYIPRGFPHAATTQVNAQTSIKLCCKSPDCGHKGDSLCTESYTLQGDKLLSTDSKGCLNRKKHDWGPLARFFSDNCSCLKKLEDSKQAVCTNILQSLHVTFGVEVEPPFEWEGLVHMSLDCWATEQNRDMFEDNNTSGSMSNDLYKGLLHVAVRQCGDKCSAFRQACSIAAKSRHKEVYITDRFESFFKGLIQKVADIAAFKEALYMVLTAIDTPASTSLDWMHWLRHLSGKPESTVWSDPLTFFHDRLIDRKACIGSLEDMEVKFTVAKNRFVSCASYAQASDAFIGLLHRYRSVRRKYRKGMLALHV